MGCEMLPREVTRWTAACDRRLHRLVSSLHHTTEHAQICCVGDSPFRCWLALFANASSAEDLWDSKSTPGGILCLVGPNTYVPINWLCKNQGAPSHSPSEAGVISILAGARLEGLPSLSRCGTLLSRYLNSHKQRLIWLSMSGSSCTNEIMICSVLSIIVP